MRIGVDARRIDGKGGMDRYTRELVFALSRIDRENEYILFGDNTGVFKDRYGENFVCEDTKKRFRMLHRSFPSILWKRKFNDIDVFHFPANDVWYSKYCKTVVTLHDIVPLKYTAWHFVSENEKARYLRHLAFIKKNSDFILTDSQYEKNEIIRLLNVAPEKISVTYLAVSSNLMLNASFLKPASELMEGKFILFVGSFEKRKNLEGLIKAFKVISDSFHELKLAVVARRKKGDNDEDIKTFIKKLKIEGKVVFLNDISDNRKLLWLYKNARVFVFPSFDEGFGMPPLEAMAAGTPVVSSNTGPMPEVLEDAVVMCNPYRPETIAEGIKNILVDVNLRKTLVEKGYRQVKKYSWDKTAEETLKIYHRVAEES